MKRGKRYKRCSKLLKELLISNTCIDVYKRQVRIVGILNERDCLCYVIFFSGQWLYILVVLYQLGTYATKPVSYTHLPRESSLLIVIKICP